MQIISPNVEAGTRDPSARADGKRVVNCPIKGNEPIAAARCMEAQGNDCYCPSAPGALAGMAELLETHRRHMQPTEAAEDRARRTAQFTQLGILKKRAEELGPAAFAGPAVSVQRNSTLAPIHPPPSPAAAAPANVWRQVIAGHICACGQAMRRRKGKYADRCSRCREQDRRTKWTPCPNFAKGCHGRLRPDNKTGLCSRCVHGVAAAPARRCSTGCGTRLQANSTGDTCFRCRVKAGRANKNKVRDEQRRTKGAITKPEVRPAHLGKLSTRELANLLGAVKRELAARNGRAA